MHAVCVTASSLCLPPLFPCLSLIVSLCVCNCEYASRFPSRSPVSSSVLPSYLSASFSVSRFLCPLPIPPSLVLMLIAIFFLSPSTSFLCRICPCIKGATSTRYTHAQVHTVSVAYQHEKQEKPVSLALSLSICLRLSFRPSNQLRRLLRRFLSGNTCS